MRSALQKGPAQLTLLRTCRAARLPVFEAQTRANYTDKEQSQPQSSSVKPEQQHWLDRRFPGLREWLEAKNRRWWLKGMSAWCR